MHDGTFSKHPSMTIAHNFNVHVTDIFDKLLAMVIFIKILFEKCGSRSLKMTGLVVASCDDSLLDIWHHRLSHACEVGFSGCLLFLCMIKQENSSITKLFMLCSFSQLIKKIKEG